MAAAWAYCCRLGSQDPRGSLAATRVLGDKRCHGTTKYEKKRQWHHTTEAALDAFCVEQVQQAVEAAGEGAQLAGHAACWVGVPWHHGAGGATK